jgi:hypothetical protein
MTPLATSPQTRLRLDLELSREQARSAYLQFAVWACDVVRSQAVPVIIKSPEKLCLAQRNREPIIIMFAHRGFMVRSEAVAFSAISMG